MNERTTRVIAKFFATRTKYIYYLFLLNNIIIIITNCSSQIQKKNKKKKQEKSNARNARSSMRIVSMSI